MTENKHISGVNHGHGPESSSGSEHDPGSDSEVGSTTVTPELSQKYETKHRVKEVLGPNAWKLTPATFRHKLSGGSYLTPKHIKYIAAKIAYALNKGNARIIVTICGRHGKSQLLSVGTPPWYLDKFPDRHVMLISYGADLAQGFSRTARDYSVEHKEHLNFRVRGDVRAVDEWQTTAGGGMYAAGMGGPIIGRGAHVYLIDDYLKSAKESQSKTIQEDQWNWFQAQCITRMEPGGSIIIVAHRWNTDDLVGRIRKELPGVFEEINLPALIETEEQAAADPLGRSLNETLWPERYNLEAMLAIKQVLSNYWWQALYQQDPIPAIGGMITGDMIPVIDILPHASRLQRCRAWDLAATPGAGDWLCGTRLDKDVHSGLQYIVDVKRFQESPAGVEAKIKTTAEFDGSTVEHLIEREPGASGKIAADHLVKTVLKGHRARSVRPDQNKFLRAQPFYAAIENGLFRMLRASWNKAFCDELEAFPDGDHDDQVDTASAAYNFLNEVRYSGGTFGRESKGIAVPAQGEIDAVEATKSQVLVTGVTFGRS